MERVESSAKVDSVVVAIRDTVREVTTITIRENEQGDTLRVTTVTDRERARERVRDRVQDVRVEVKTDTVFVVRRDSVFVQEMPDRVGHDVFGGHDGGGSAFVSALRWIFGIIVLVIILVVIFKLRRI